MNTSPYLAAIVIAERQRALVGAADQYRLVRSEPEQSGLPLYPTTAWAASS